jgi:hypothetical protein
MPSHIIKFLRDESKDNRGRTLFEMQSLPDYKLSQSNDIIQWMFPTDIPSKRHPNTPVLTEEDIEIIKKDPIIQSAIQTSLARMIWFYEKNDYWITMKNHNFLRITRILRCLWLAGMKHDYVCFQKTLDDIYSDYHDIISEETFYYWKNANNKEFLEKGYKLNIHLKLPPHTKEFNYEDFNYV